MERRVFGKTDGGWDTFVQKELMPAVGQGVVRGPKLSPALQGTSRKAPERPEAQEVVRSSPTRNRSGVRDSSKDAL